MEERYELNEKDVEIVIRYLKIYDPKNATPENAISMLEEFAAGVHVLSHTNPELLEKLYEELKKNKNKRS